MRFPSWSGVFRGRKVVDRAEGVYPSFLPPPGPPTVNIVAEYGVTVCPECGEKVAVLIDGQCRDCGGDAA